MAEDYSSIADARKPNAGRIYDYLLGGHHNFEIDRQAAQQVMELAPFIPQVVRLIRWFLGEAVRRLCEEGFTTFVDFASGLPTVDHIHQIAPAGTQVVYSDIDTVTVAYAQEITKNDPNIRYIECDIGTPEILLDSDETKELLREERKVVIGVNGIAWFLPDAKISHSLELMYEWASKGSKLFLCDFDSSSTTPSGEKLTSFYSSIGQPIFSRTQETLIKLVGSWQVDEPGFQLLEKWVDLDTKVTDEVRKVIPGEGLFGVILKK